MEDEEACSKQNASVEGVSQVRIPSAHSFTQKTDICDTCGPFLKDILHLDGQQGAHPEETPYTCGRESGFSASLPQYQKEHSRDNPFRRNKDGDAFVKSTVVCLSEKPFTCRQGSKDVSDSHDHLWHSAIDSGGKPHRSTECRGSFPHSSRPVQLLKCSDCATDFQKSSALLNHLKMHSEEILFRCPIIGNSLEEKSTLDNYQKFHTGEASHVCKECGKAFSHPSK